MSDLLTLISRHGYLLLAVICFAEAIGLPLPASLAILTAGAVAAYGRPASLLRSPQCPARPDCRRCGSVFRRPGHRLGAAWLFVPTLGESGNLHPAIG